MIDVERFVGALKSAGVCFFTGVPDSLLKSFCAYVTDNCAENHVIAANEGGAVARISRTSSSTTRRTTPSEASPQSAVPSTSPPSPPPADTTAAERRLSGKSRSRKAPVPTSAAPRNPRRSIRRCSWGRWQKQHDWRLAALDGIGHMWYNTRHNDDYGDSRQQGISNGG